MTEELRPSSQQRNDRGLIDVAPLRMAAANDEVELVAEEAVMGIPHRVHEQNQDARKNGDRNPHRS